MTRKCICIHFDDIFKVTTYHYRLCNFKVTNKNGKIISLKVKTISQKETQESHIRTSI